MFPRMAWGTWITMTTGAVPLTPTLPSPVALLPAQNADLFVCFRGLWLSLLNFLAS